MVWRRMWPDLKYLGINDPCARKVSSPINTVILWEAVTEADLTNAPTSGIRLDRAVIDDAEAGAVVGLVRESVDDVLVPCDQLVSMLCSCPALCSTLLWATLCLVHHLTSCWPASPPNLYLARVSAFSTYQARSLFSSISNAVKPLPMKRKGLAVRYVMSKSSGRRSDMMR